MLSKDEIPGFITFAHIARECEIPLAIPGLHPRVAGKAAFTRSMIGARLQHATDTKALPLGVNRLRTKRCPQRLQSWSFYIPWDMLVISTCPDLPAINIDGQAQS
jgi:hypothetical protein